MKIYEIIGDTEVDVYNKLRNIYFILTVTKDIKLTSAAKNLRNNSLNELFEDEENLNYWILASERIPVLFNEIKKVL